MRGSVLIVEDEAMVALEMEAVLKRAGFTVSGCAGSVEKALAMLDDRDCDVAVLDANLRGRSVEPVAAALQHRGTPFLFVSGYGRVYLPARFLHAPFVSKPFDPPDLVRAVSQILA